MKAADLRAIAAETEGGAARTLYLLLAESYERLGAPRMPKPSFGHEKLK